ncbi:MAG: ribonuclease H [Myxococcota bacterium]|nr:ribonuclease H [Myxococcota bacterium]
MPWKPMLLRGAKVLARVDAAGEPVAEGGRVEIRYKPNDGRAYRAGVRNLTPVDGAAILPDAHCAEAEVPESQPSAKGGARKPKKKSSKKSAAPPPHEEGAIIVYADGACSGNPGPAGLGVLILDGDDSRELSEYLGEGTNNVGELTAILRAASELAGTDKPVRIYTDSQYSIGVLTKGWKPKKNKELIRDVKAALAQIDDVVLHYVPGHAGHDFNEKADQLAREAVETRGKRGWEPVTPFA